jgi:hypothetical protein
MSFWAVGLMPILPVSQRLTLTRCTPMSLANWAWVSPSCLRIRLTSLPFTFRIERYVNGLVKRLVFMLCKPSQQNGLPKANVLSLPSSPALDQSGEPNCLDLSLAGQGVKVVVRYAQYLGSLRDGKEALFGGLGHALSSGRVRGPEPQPRSFFCLHELTNERRQVLHVRPPDDLRQRGQEFARAHSSPCLLRAGRVAAFSGERYWASYTGPQQTRQANG